MQKLTCILYLIVCSTAQLRAEQLEGMIVGGEFAQIVYYPHAVFLRITFVEKRKKHNWVCGGSIVNQKIILTAGHCIANCDSSAVIQARVGNELNYMGSLYKIDSFVLHEGYVANTLLNDIALLRTEKAIKFNKRVSRVALMKEPPYFEKADVTGWGIMDIINEITSPNLKVLAQNVWSHSDCLKTLKHMLKGTICAAADSVLEFAAEGDSGSALMVRGYIQIGIVSHKIPLRDNHLIIYADAGYYYKWIKYYARAIYCMG